MNVGDISVSILVDDKTFKQSIQNAFKLTADVGKNFDALGNNQGFTKLKDSITKTNESLSKTSESIKKTNDSVSMFDNSIAGMKKRLEFLNREMERSKIGSDSFNRLKDSVIKLSDEISKASKKQIPIPNPAIANSIQGLKDKLSTLNKEFENVSIGSKRFKELKDEISKTNQELSKATGPGGFAKLKEFAGSSLGQFGIALGAGKLVTDVIRIGSAFNAQMSEVQAASSSTTEQFKLLKDEARRLGATTSFSATQAAEGMTELAKAGFSADQILGATNSTLNLAKAGSLGLAESTTILADTLSGFGLKSSDTNELLANSARVSDVLAKSANMSSINVSMLGETFKYVSGVAKVAGASLEQVSGMTVILGNAGTKGSMAGTTLKSVFLDLAAPTSAATRQLKGMGISVTEVVDGVKKMRSMPDIFADLAAKMQNDDPTKKLTKLKDIFGVIPAAGVAQLLDKSLRDTEITIDGVTKKVSELDQTISNVYEKGYAQKIGDIKGANLEGDYKILMSSLEELYLIIYDGLDPALRGLTQMFSMLAVILGNTLKPILQTVFTPISEGIQLAIELVSKLISSVLDYLAPAFNFMGSSILPFVNIFKDILKYSATIVTLTGLVIGLGMAFSFISTTIKSKLIPSIIRMHLALMANPIYLIVAAFVAGIALIIKTLDYMQENWTKFETELNVINDSVDGLIQVFSELWDVIVSAFNNAAVVLLINAFSSAEDSTNKLNKQIDMIGTTFKVLGNIISLVINGASAFIQSFVVVLSGIIGILANIAKFIVGVFALFGGNTDIIKSAVIGIYNAFVGMFIRLFEVAKKWATNVWQLIKNALSGNLVMNLELGVQEQGKADKPKTKGIESLSTAGGSGKGKGEQDFASDKKLIEEWYKQNPIVAQMTTGLEFRSMDEMKKQLIEFKNKMSKDKIKLSLDGAALNDAKIKALKDYKDIEKVVSQLSNQLKIKDVDSTIKQVFGNFKEESIKSHLDSQNKIDNIDNEAFRQKQKKQDEIEKLEKKLSNTKNERKKEEIRKNIEGLKLELDEIEKNKDKNINVKFKIQEAQNVQDYIRGLNKQADEISKSSMSNKMTLEAEIKFNQSKIDKEVDKIKLKGVQVGNNEFVGGNVGTSNEIELRTKINDAESQSYVNEIRKKGLQAKLDLHVDREKLNAELDNIMAESQIRYIKLDIDIAKVNAKLDEMKKEMDRTTGENSFTKLFIDIQKEVDTFKERWKSASSDFDVIGDTLKKIASALNLVGSVAKQVGEPFVKLLQAQAGLEKAKFDGFKQNLQIVGALVDKFYDNMIANANNQFKELDDRLKAEETLEEQSLKARGKLDDEEKRRREQAEYEHQLKLEQIKKDFELKAQLAKDEFAQKEKERLDLLMQAELDKLNLEFENKLLYIENNSATDEEEQINKELTIADHEARKAEIQTGYKDLLAQNIEGKNSEIDEKEKNRKQDYADWENMFNETKLAADDEKNLSIDQYETLRKKKLDDADRAKQLEKEQFEISLETKREERAQQRENAEKARDEATKKAEEEKAKAKKLSALIEYMAGFSVFQAEQKGKIASVQMNLGLLIMNSVAGIAASFATGAIPGAIIGMAIAGVITALGIAAASTSIAAIQSTKYPPFLAFAEGGQVPGIGNVDSVPAMLTPGEIVMPERNFRDISSSLQPANNMNSNVNKYYLIENGRESELSENEFDRRVDSRINYVIRNVR